MHRAPANRLVPTKRLAPRNARCEDTNAPVKSPLWKVIRTTPLVSRPTWEAAQVVPDRILEAEDFPPKPRITAGAQLDFRSFQLLPDPESRKPPHAVLYRCWRAVRNRAGATQ